MARCEGECDVSPIGSTVAEVNNGFLPMNDKTKENSENVIPSRTSDNSSKDHGSNIAGDLISLESPRHTYLGNSLNSSENLSSFAAGLQILRVSPNYSGVCKPAFDTFVILLEGD